MRRREREKERERQETRQRSTLINYMLIKTQYLALCVIAYCLTGRQQRYELNGVQASRSSVLHAERWLHSYANRKAENSLNSY